MRLQPATLACSFALVIVCSGSSSPIAEPPIAGPDTASSRPSPKGSPESPKERSPNNVVTYDDKLGRVGRDFPGFSGFEVDVSKGRLTIYSTRVVRDFESLQETIARVFRDDLAELEPEVVLRQYSFRQLRRWYQDIGSYAFSLDGVTMTDINETSNTIDIGVKDVQRYAPDIYEAARQAGIPTGAVRVVHMPPIEISGA